MIKNLDHKQSLQSSIELSKLVNNVSRAPSGQSFERHQHAPVIVLTATIETLNSPDDIAKLYQYLISSNDISTAQGMAHAVEVTEVMREATLKTITLNGVAKAINCLSALREAIPDPVRVNLSKEPSR